MYCYNSKEISDLIEVTKNLSKSLDNVAKYSVDSRVLQWEKKYKVIGYYNKARKFLAIPEIKEMFEEIENIYKRAFGERWKEELNEKPK